MAAPTSALQNRIGLGVDLEGGDEVLSTLRAIAESEREIVRIAGRSSSSTSSQGRSTSAQQQPQATKQAAIAALGGDPGSLQQAVANKQQARQKDVQNARQAGQQEVSTKNQFNSMFTAADKARTAAEKSENRARESEARRHTNEMARIAEAERHKTVYEPPMGGTAAAVHSKYPGQYVLGQRAMDAEREKMARYEKKYGAGYLPEGGFIGAQEQGIGARALAEVARRREEAERSATQGARRRDIRAGLRTREQPDDFTKDEEARTKRLISRLERFKGLSARRAAELDRQEKELDRLFNELATQQRARGLRTPDEAEAERRAAAASAGAGPAPSARRAIPTDPARAARLAESRRQVELAQFESQFGGARSTLDKTRDKLAQFQKTADTISLKHAGSDVGTAAARMSRDLSAAQRRAEALRREIAAPANMKRTAQEVERDLAVVDRHLHQTTENIRRLRREAAEAPGQFRATGQGRFGSENPFGALATAQRIGRNLLIYAAVRGFTTDLQQFITSSVEAARVAEQTQRQLEFTSRAAHASFEGNIQIANSIRREVFVSRRLADAAVAEATMLAQEGNRLSDVEGLTRAAADISAKRGRGVEKIDEGLRAVAIGGRGFQELYGVRGDELYRREAEKRATAAEKAGLPERDEAGRRYLTHSEAVAKLVAAMSDEEKTSLRINEVLRQGNQVRGAAADRANTMAGRVEIMNQRWEDAKVAVGNFVLALTPALAILEKITGYISKLDPGRNRITGTGQGGQITATDVTAYANAYPQTAAYRASRFLNETGPTVLGGLGLAGAGLFFGRSRARQEYQQRAFRSTFEQGVEYGLTPEQARAEAQTTAQAARPGMLRSIGTGLRSITQAITTTTLDVTARVARFIGAEGASTRLAGMSAQIRQGIRSLSADVEGLAPAIVARRQQTAERATRYAGRLGTVAGVGGGVLGAQVGLMIAEKMNVGPITATLLTITGGIVGTALGTALGQGAGSYLANAGGIAAFLSSPTGIALLTTAAGAIVINRIAQSNYEYAARQEAITGASNRALAEQRAQMDAAREEGRTYFREKGIGGIDQRTGQYRIDPNADLTRRYSKEQVEALVQQGRNRAQFEEVLESPEMTADRVTRENNATKARERQEKDSAEFNQRIREEEQKEAQDRLSRQTAALAKLRDFVANSGQVIANIAGQYVTDNPFVQIFADGATAAERMKQQWGFMGDETVRYFTQLEQRSVGLRQLSAEFDSLAAAMNHMAEARRLERERGQGLTGNETRLTEAYRAGVTAATQNPELYDMARKLRGQYVQTPDDQLREQYGNLRRNRNVFAGQAAGLGDEARDAIEAIIDEGFTSLAQRAGNRVFRPGLQGLRLDAADAYERSAQRNDRAVERAVERVRIGAEAGRDVDRMLTAQERLAQRARLEGREEQEVARQLDRQILAVTGAIDPKELSNRAYAGRIEALKREAQRDAQKEQEARDAVKRAEEQRGTMIDEVKKLREALIRGDASVLIQVANDTEARIDTEALQDANAEKPMQIGYPKPKSSMGRYNRRK